MSSSWSARVSPQLNHLWRGHWRAGTVEPARYLYDHEIVLVTEGSCTVRLAGARHELRAGDYIIIPPDTLHVTSTSTGVHRACIHFDWIWTGKKKRPVCAFHPRRPLAARIVRRPSFVPDKNFRGSFQPFVPALVETIFHRWRTGQPRAQALARATFLEMLTLLLHPAGPTAPARQLSCDHAWRVRDLLDRSLQSDKAIRPLLLTLGFSYPHLCRLFHRAFGLTPVEYRNAARLERAKTLLADPKLTVAEAAYAAGFQDAGYFARQFRRQNGLSPAQWRASSFS